MNEIVISKRTFIIILLIIALGVLAIWWAPKLLGNLEYGAVEPQAVIPMPQALSSNGDSQAQAAALAGAQAFYSVDYQAGYQAWLDRLCSLSTETGCIVYQNVIGPNFWVEIEQAKTVMTATVTAEEKVREQIAVSRGNAPMQVWRIQVELSSPLPQQKDPQTKFPALALVIQEKGEWKFERFLSEEEALAFGKEGGLP